MGKFFKKYFWTIIIVLASLGLAGSAAYFSVSGLSKLFAGSALQIIIMASFIEFGKIITTAALHRYWKAMKDVGLRMLKYILTLMVVVVMAITSSGIYGFLADAYSSTATELDKIKGQIELIEKQKEQKQVVIDGINEAKEMKSTRIKSLVELRSQQEVRVDSLRNKGWVNSMRRAEKAIAKADEEVEKLQIEIDSSFAKINRVNKEIGELDIQILDLQNSDVATEIGPLKYMSTVTGSPMENIINWFILALIFVFDPLAVLLIVFANVVYDRANEKHGIPVKKKKIEEEVVDDEIAITTSDDITVTDSSDSGVVEFNINDSGIEEEEQRVVDAINNNSKVYDFSYEFPEKKGEEVVEYVESEQGGFEKSEEEVEKSIASIIQRIDSNPVYLQLLDVLFLDGNRTIGEIIPSYPVFSRNIKERGIECEDKVINNFLMICNLLKITDMRDKDRVKIIKNYQDSKNIISLVSK